MPIVAIPSTEEKQISHQKSEGMIITVGPPKAIPISREENYAEKLSSISGIQQLGPMFRTSEMVELTESETEYVICCIKHSYSRHLVLQFDCVNTLNDQLLENVRVEIDPSDGYKVIKEIPCAKLPYNETGTTYVILQYPDDLPNTVGTFGAVLKFVVKDCDPNTGLPDTDEGNLNI